MGMGETCKVFSFQAVINSVYVTCPLFNKECREHDIPSFTNQGSCFAYDIYTSKVLAQEFKQFIKKEEAFFSKGIIHVQQYCILGRPAWKAGVNPFGFDFREIYELTERHM